MYIKFESITLKNIGSFGNKKTTFNYENGFHLVSASNGSGKSTMLMDAITFGLFGKPYRDVKVNDLINRQNKKALEVTVKFSDDTDSYEITRGLKPGTLIIRKNGKEMDQLSSKKLTQEEINKIIGIDYYVFKNVVNLSYTNSESYMKMGKAAKEALIESVFNVKIFSEMHKKMKQEYSLTKTSLEIKESEYLTYTDQLKNYKEQYKSIESSIKSFDTDKQANLDKLNDELNDINLKLSKTAQNIAKGQKAYRKIDNDLLSTLKENRTNSKNTLVETNTKITLEEERLSVLHSDNCPTCNSDLDGDFGHSIRNEIQENISTKRSLVEELQSIIREEKETIDKLEDDIEFNNNLTTNLEKAQTKFDTLNEKIESLEERIQDEHDRTLDYDLDHLKGVIKKCHAEFKVIKSELSRLSKEIVYQKNMITILSQKGIKTYFMNRLVPILNNSTNKFFEKLGLSLFISFDDYLNPKIYDISKPKEAIDYNTFSGGESKRIDLSIAFSFIEILRQINNWDTNILTLDEVIDANLDDDGLSDVIDSLSDFIHNSSKEIGVYLVSFRNVEGDQFDSKWRLYKLDKFSQLERAST